MRSLQTLDHDESNLMTRENGVDFRKAKPLLGFSPLVRMGELPVQRRVPWAEVRVQIDLTVCSHLVVERVMETSDERDVSSQQLWSLTRGTGEGEMF